MWTLGKPIGTILVLLSIFLFSQSAEAKYSGGSGTADDPYRISTVEQMNAVRAGPNDWGEPLQVDGTYRSVSL